MEPDGRRAAARIERRVFRFIDDHGLIAEDTALLLAVSGGPDSLALLHIISKLREQLGVHPTVVYVDHRLRPHDDIAAERAFVEGQSDALGLAFASARTLVEQAGDRRRSPEDAARHGRYTALARIASEVGATVVATGHTRSDQAETVLLRLVGGSGLRGLAAMAPSADWPIPLEGAPRLIRPLLGLSRRETTAYCDSLRLSPRDDPENRNPRYMRNRVRREIVPQLESLNPRIEAVLADLADEVQSWRAASQAAPPQVERQQDQFGRGRLLLDVHHLRSMEPPARRAALRSALSEILPAGARVGRAHLVALEQLAHGPRGRWATLPSGRWAWREHEDLVLAQSRPTAPPPLDADHPVLVGCTLELPGWRIEAALSVGGGVSVGTRWEQVLDHRAVGGLAVGPRRPGDRIQLSGMSGHRRVQDLFVDEGVPRELRDSWPVFRSRERVVWIPGVARIAAWATPKDGPGLRLRVRRKLSSG